MDTDRFGRRRSRRTTTPLQVWLSRMLAQHFLGTLGVVAGICVGLTVIIAVLVAINLTVGLVALFTLMAVLFLGVVALFVYFRSYFQALGWVLLCAGIGLAVTTGNQVLFFVVGGVGIALMVIFKKG